MLVRFGAFSLAVLAALALLAVLADDANAQRAYTREQARARRAAMVAAREAETLARERANAARADALRRQLAEEEETELADRPSVGLFDDFEDPLDEIDDFEGDYDADSATGLARDLPGADDPNDVDIQKKRDGVNALDPFDALDDERDHADRGSLALDLYRAAERELAELDSVRPYDPRDDTPGLDPTTPIDTVDGELDVPDSLDPGLAPALDAELEPDPFVEP